MPMSMTHHYIAKDVFEKLDLKVQAKLKNSYHDYLVYANGFDILFFGFDIKNIKKSIKVMKLGDIAQDSKTNEFLINVTEKIKKSQNEVEFSFLSGLITHYIADRTIHPYINYKASLLAKKPLTLSDCHFNIESYLDNYLIRKRESGDYLKFKVYKELALNLGNYALKDLIESSFSEVFKIKDIGRYYYKALKNMNFFFHYLRDDSLGIKHGFYLSVNFLAKRLFRDVSHLSYHFKLDNDSFVVNEEHDKWFNIEDKRIVKSDSFNDLYKEVIKESVRVINEVYGYLFEDREVDLEKLYKNISYSTGLVLK